MSEELESIDTKEIIDGIFGQFEQLGDAIADYLKYIMEEKRERAQEVQTVMLGLALKKAIDWREKTLEKHADKIAGVLAEQIIEKAKGE